MSKEVNKDEAAESDKPLTEEELEAVVGGNDPIPFAGDNPNTGTTDAPPLTSGDVPTSAGKPGGQSP